jgi:hypothetical protein
MAIGVGITAGIIITTGIIGAIITGTTIIGITMGIITTMGTIEGEIHSPKPVPDGRLLS